MKTPGDRKSTMRILSTLFCAAIYCIANPVFAASYFLPADIGSGPFSSCSGGGPSYTCSNSISIGNNDDLTLAADVTLVINGDLEFGNSFEVITNGNTLTLDVDGDVDLGNSIDFSGDISATGNVDIGNNGTIDGDINSNGNLIIGTTTVNGNCTPSHPNCTGGGGGGGNSCETFRDNFDNTSYGNQDGTVNWTSNWVESNDNGSPNNGDIRIEGNRLRIKDNNVSVSRAADLSAYSLVTLRFDYQETGYDNNNDSINVEVQGGGSGWQSLQSFVGSAVNSGSANLTIPAQYLASDFELRFITSNTTGNGDNFYVDNLEIEACSSGGGGTCNVGDNFNNVSFIQNDGTENWSGDWLEVLEFDGPSSGIARVRNDNCTSGNCLRLGVPSGTGAQTYSGIGVRREVDLSGVGFADLTFNYRTGFGGGTASVDLWVSNDGGSNWNLLQTYNITATSFTATAQSFDISAYASSNTQIRFTANGTSATTGFYVDDVAISYPCVKIPVAEWRLDETSWNGTAGEVIDSGINGLHGRSIGGGVPVPAQVCNGASLSGANQILEIADNTLLDIDDELTVTAWINLNAIPSSGLMTIISKDENFEFHINSAAQINWWWGGGARELTTTGTALAVGNWAHVAIVYSDAANAATIYIDGAVRATKTISGALTLNNDPFQIGGDQGFAGRYFNGLIDEVRVYNDALSMAEIMIVMNETRICPFTGPDHYQVTHSGQGITCEAEPIIITAHDAADTAVVPSSSTTITLSTSISNDGWSLQTGGGSFNALTNQYTFDGTETAATFLLSKIAPVTGMDIDVTDTSATDQDGSATEDQNINFVDSGFRFFANNVVSDIGIQIAGKESNMAPGIQTLKLSAVETNSNTGACQARIPAGQHTIQMGFECINPTSCKTGNGVTITDLNGAAGGSLADNPQGTPISSFNVVDLTFDINGEATWTMNYLDVGQIRLHASYLLLASGPEPAFTLTGSSNPFVTVPAGLCVSSSDTNAACSMPYANCNPAFRKTGEAFNLDIRAVAWGGAIESDTEFCSGNSTTPNFELNNINIIQSLVAPSPGAVGAAGVTAFNMVAGDDGDHNINNQTASEVGVFSYTASPPSYLGTTIAASTSAEIGRFTPDHFAITNPDNGMLNASCSSNFTYIGQEFGYLSAPSFIIEAQNASNNPTLNYQGNDWAKIRSSGAYAVSTVTEDETQVGTDPITKLAIYHGLPTNRINIDSDNSDGTFNASFGADVFCYGSDDLVSNGGCNKLVESQVAAFDSEIKLTLSSIGDGDVITALTQDFTPIGSQQRFGRLSMDNAFGSELIDLIMPMYTEIFDGSNFVINNGTMPLVGGDNCSVVNTVDLDITPSLTGGTSDVTVIPPAANAGVFNLNLTAPGAGNTGSILIGHLPTTVDSWLKYDWDGGGIYDDDPSATATFGIYEGNDVNIYIQQIYQP
jgi:hypothetical protein